MEYWTFITDVPPFEPLILPLPLGVISVVFSSHEINNNMYVAVFVEHESMTLCHYGKS